MGTSLQSLMIRTRARGSSAGEWDEGDSGKDARRFTVQDVNPASQLTAQLLVLSLDPHVRHPGPGPRVGLGVRTRR